MLGLHSPPRALSTQSVRRNSSSHPSQLTLKWPVSQGATGLTRKSERLSRREANAGVQWACLRERVRVGGEGEGQEETKPESHLEPGHTGNSRPEDMTQRLF